jgi:elongation factor 3
MVSLNAYPADKQLSGVSKDAIRQQLKDVGFDEQRQSEPVGGLSGGWKMKVR